MSIFTQMIERLEKEANDDFVQWVEANPRHVVGRSKAEVTKSYFSLYDYYPRHIRFLKSITLVQENLVFAQFKHRADQSLCDVMMETNEMRPLLRIFIDLEHSNDQYEECMDALQRIVRISDESIVVNIVTSFMEYLVRWKTYGQNVDNPLGWIKYQFTWFDKNDTYTDYLCGECYRDKPKPNLSAIERVMYWIICFIDCKLDKLYD